MGAWLSGCVLCCGAVVVRDACGAEPGAAAAVPMLRHRLAPPAHRRYAHHRPAAAHPRCVDGQMQPKWFWLSKWFAEAWVCVSRVECVDAGADDSSAGDRRRWGQPGPLPPIRAHPAPLALLALPVLAVCARRMFGPMQAEERALVDVQVMTCANYIKLPKYSSPEVLKTQLSKVRSPKPASFFRRWSDGCGLWQAITDGQGSFDLS